MHSSMDLFSDRWHQNASDEYLGNFFQADLREDNVFSFDGITL